MPVPQNSLFTMIGASNHTDKVRECNDYYATDPVALDALVNDGGVQFSPNVWECACGGGHLARKLESLGYVVKATDLIDRGYGETGVDFLDCNEKFDGDILTNPPYKLAQEFVEHALTLIPDGRKCYMFLKVQFLEGKGRRALFDKYPPKVVYVCSSRVLCAKNGDFDIMIAAGGSAVAYAWYEWEKGWYGDPIIKWIN